MNPLYREAGYGWDSHYGSMIAHPMFPMAYGWIGRTRWGLPGVHGWCTRHERKAARDRGK